MLIMIVGGNNSMYGYASETHIEISATVENVI